MAVLRNSERAILDIRKIEDYCLNLAHPRGRHKARLFLESIGLIRSDSVWLRRALLNGVKHNEAVELAVDRFGVRWRVDVPVSRHNKNVMVRTVWIVQTGEEVPRFVTCWAL